MEFELPRYIQFGREICGDLAQAERREWWLANGRGGYAAGTIAGTLTRRYHGLLIAPLEVARGRSLVFAKAEATLFDGHLDQPLYVNRWASGAVEPRGDLHIEHFHLDGRLPVWRYAIGDLRIEARVWMEPGAHTTYVAYRLLPAAVEQKGLRLWVRLLINARNHHAQTFADDFSPPVETDATELKVGLAAASTLRFRTCCGTFHPHSTWIDNFQLMSERQRGLPDSDSHLCVGQMSVSLHEGEWVGFVASLEENPSPYLTEALDRCRRYDAMLLRRAKVLNGALSEAPDWIEQLVFAADGFLVSRPRPAENADAESMGDVDGCSVIAGYPWFCDWGRDCFIALPGLTLSTCRHDEACRILEHWAHFIDAGMLPNRLPEDGAAPEYNSVDAALWYIEAWRAYTASSQDTAALRRHFPALSDIIEHYARGTRHGISSDPKDGLLHAGEPGVQLTWMDAKVGGWVVTPRIGKPVEVNALWYNALRAMAEFAEALELDSEPYRVRAERVRAGFKRYLCPNGEGLADVLDGPHGDDLSLRPNQILAVSLAHSPLGLDEQAAVVRTVGERLLTSYGLRTLDPAHTDYRARYEGGVVERDSAYHQGPAWAWLLGHYAMALYRVSGDAQVALSLLQPLRDHLCDAGLGTISELFDADPPHTPRGTPSQAWSVACTLHAWCQLEQARRMQAKSSVGAGSVGSSHAPDPRPSRRGAGDGIVVVTGAAASSTGAGRRVREDGR